MDVQLKKGLLDICVLACLSRHDSYGYQIIKDVGQVVEISESTLYPVLRRLETSQAIINYDVAHNGRLRKYFTITEEGKKRLQEFKTQQDKLIRIYEYINGA